MAKFLLLQCVYDGALAGENSVGYWNFIPVSNRETPLPAGVMFEAESQHAAMRQFMDTLDVE